MPKGLLSLLFFYLLLSGCVSTKQVSQTTEIERLFAQIKSDSVTLHAFFSKMPKGGDLHHHASGTPYAEQYIVNAKSDGLWVDTLNYSLQLPKISDSNRHSVSITQWTNDKSYAKDSLINYWSTRNYKERGLDGHQLFFSSFGRFKHAFIGHEAALLSAMCQKAQKDHISYLETMIRVANIQDSIAQIAPSNFNLTTQESREQRLERLYQTLKDKGMDTWVNANVDSLASYYNNTNKNGITLRFQTYGIRVLDNPALTFAQLLLGFETAQKSPYLVGVNFVAPEDHPKALANYDLHMAMFAFLGKKFPKVPIAIHAGELAHGKGAAQNDDFKDHIEKAVRMAGAQRIGHGVGILEEENAQETLAYMRKKGIAVEINLRSNEVILERNPKNHPIRAYWKAGVPVCISTDDEGVLRTDLTAQYLLLTQYLPELGYADIKSIVLNGIQYAFLEPRVKKELLQKLKNDFTRFEKDILSAKAIY
ncbi:amidohydrolase family protein [Sediminicola luteus]|nr:hypothetical protein [Sediminicola luteus]